MKPLTLFSDKKESYFLMNKDDLLLVFYKISVGSGYIFNIDEASIQKIPPNFRDINTFLSSRTIIANRDSIERILSNIGLSERFDLALANYGISMNDTLWIKRADDKMTWDKINPYNKERVFELAWFCSDKDKSNLHVGRPEYSTDGNFPKCWVKQDGVDKLIKCGSSGAYNAGLEPFSEILSCQLLEALDYKKYVPYELCEIDYTKFGYKFLNSKYMKEIVSPTIEDNIRIASVCDSFTNEQIGYVPMRYYSEGSSYQELLQKADFCNDLSVMLLFDCLSLNVDRHTGNFGYLVDNNNFNTIEFAPIFDSNLALAPYWVPSLDGNLNSYAATCSSKFGNSFIELGAFILQNRPDLIEKVRAVAKYFEFKTTEPYSFKLARLEALSTLVRTQAILILKNSERR
ncbi:MAG: hypothetical protein ACLTTN_03465 [Coprococcus eutactus]